MTTVQCPTCFSMKKEERLTYYCTDRPCEGHECTDPWHTTAAPAPQSEMYEDARRALKSLEGRSEHYQILNLMNWRIGGGLIAPADPVATEGKSAREWILKTLAQFKGGAMTVTEQNGDVALTTFVGINGQRYLLSELLEAYAATLREKLEDVNENPKVADCCLCGSAILAKQERTSEEDGKWFHPICKVTQRASSAEATVSAQEQVIRECLPYVKNWSQANEDGWIEKKFRVIELAESALVTEKGNHEIE